LKFGKCITCSKKYTNIKEYQAGHFCPAGSSGFGLRFDPRNIHGECGGCNGFNQFHLIPYKKNLIKRYGKKFVDDLEKRYDDYKYKGILIKE
jgi:hypothetical protein